MEGFPCQGNACNHITNINVGNLVEGQLVYLCSQKLMGFVILTEQGIHVTL
jgi:hypothetical protein